MKTFLALMFFLISLTLSAQLPCGTTEPQTPIDHDHKQIYQEIIRLDQTNKMDPRIFMMNLNIIRSTAGTQGISEQEVIAALDELNQAYQFANIRFEMCDDFNYIDNSNLLTTENFEVAGLMNAYNLDNVINVYFIPEVKNGNGEGICGSASFPSTNKSERRVLMDNDCVDNGSTFIHELGHFFNLRHTHSTAGGAERVARINCESTGDGFCDTPADPRLSSSNVSSCNYVGTEVDAVGDSYDPDETNFMSYAPKVCRYSFTSEQEAAISLAAQGVNDYLRSSCGISDYSVSKAAAEDLTVELFSDLNFDLKIQNTKFITGEKPKLTMALSATNAGKDIVIRDENIEFSQENEEIIKDINISFSEDLMSHRYLNIWIDSDYMLDEFNENNNRVSYELKSKTGIEDQVKFFPNPVVDEASLFLSSQLDGNLIVEVFDLQGRLVRNYSIQKQNRFVLKSFDFSDLQTNLYLLKLTIDDEKLEPIKFYKN